LDGQRLALEAELVGDAGQHLAITRAAVFGPREYELWPHQAQHVAEIMLAVEQRDGAGDGARAGDGVLQDDAIQRCGQLVGDDVTRTHATRGEPTGGALHELGELGERDGVRAVIDGDLASHALGLDLEELRKRLAWPSSFA